MSLVVPSPGGRPTVPPPPVAVAAAGPAVPGGGAGIVVVAGVVASYSTRTAFWLIGSWRLGRLRGAGEVVSLVRSRRIV